MCVMAVVGVAPCQCFSPGSNQITSPGRISSIGPPQRCTRPQPAVTIKVWPSGWLCQAVRAPGSNVTLTPTARAGSDVWNTILLRLTILCHQVLPFCHKSLAASTSKTGKTGRYGAKHMRIFMATLWFRRGKDGKSSWQSSTIEEMGLCSILGKSL